jgi:beta-galactosidase
VRGRDFVLEVDRATGTIASWRHDGTELLRSGPVPGFWRPPNDNDVGNGMPKRLAAWREASLSRVVERVEVRSRTERSVEILVETRPAGDVGIHRVTYEVLGSGDVLVHGEFQPSKNSLPELARFGMTMTLPGSMNNLEWLGRGPHESYWDRKTSAAVGLYEGTVWEQYHPYVRPQEFGNKTDVRWLALADERGVGIAVFGMPLVSASAWRLTFEDLEGKQRHTIDVKPRDLVTLNVDLAQMGVGGDDSWGARPHPEYSLPPQRYAYSFRMRPISRSGEPAAMLSRQTPAPSKAIGEPAG